MSDKPQATFPVTAGTRWKRWEMSTFDTRSDHLDQQDRVPSKRAEEIATRARQAQEALRKKARSEGYDAGHAQGVQAGFDEGKQAGHEEGRQLGHDEGYRAGHAQGMQKAQEEMRRLTAVTSSCAQAIDDIEAEVGQALVSLGIRIAEHILHSTLDAHPEKIIDMVQEVLQANIQTDQATLSLQINPADLALVRQYLDTEPATRNWRLHPNDSIEPGGCIAETALGSIDATLQTRWRRTLAMLGRSSLTDDNGHER